MAGSLEQETPYLMSNTQRFESLECRLMILESNTTELKIGLDQTNKKIKGMEENFEAMKRKIEAKLELLMKMVQFNLRSHNLSKETHLRNRTST